MLRPGGRAGKAVFVVAVQQFGQAGTKNRSIPPIIASMSRLEPGAILGQKGALPARPGGGLRLVARLEVLDGAVAERLKAAVC